MSSTRHNARALNVRDILDPEGILKDQQSGEIDYILLSSLPIIIFRYFYCYICVDTTCRWSNLWFLFITVLVLLLCGGREIKNDYGY